MGANAGAYTAVDRAESELELAKAVNTGVQGPCRGPGVQQRPLSPAADQRLRVQR